MPAGFSIYPGLNDVRSLTHIGDTMIVLFGGLGKVAFIPQFLDPDSFYIERSFFVDTNWAVDMIYKDDKEHSL